jgi:hypothetical protein
MPRTGIASSIRSVTVYARGATIRRDLVLPADDKPDEICLGDLPLCLDDTSVTIHVESETPGGPAAHLPVATDVRIVLDVPNPDPTLPPPRDKELEAAELEEQRLRNRFTQIKKTIEAIGQLAMIPRPAGPEGEPPPDAPTAARMALLQFQQTTLDDLHDRKREVGRALRKTRRQRQDLADRKQRNSSARQAREHELRKSVLVRLQWDSVPADATRLVVEYFVPGARWAPSYSVRFDETMRKASLTIRALICQKTGEDWTDALVTCSTAMPQRWIERRELRSIRIGRQQGPPPSSGWRPLPDDLDQLYESYDQAFVQPSDIEAIEPQLAVPLSDGMHAAHSQSGDPMAQTMVVAEASDSEIVADTAGTGSGLLDLTHEPEETFLGAGMLSDVGDDSGEGLALESKGDRDPNAETANLSATDTSLLETLTTDADSDGAPPVGANKSVFERAGGGGLSDTTKRLVKKKTAAAKRAQGALAVQFDMLDYMRLRMPSASRNDRGKLRFTETSRVYLEYLERQELLVSFNVIQTIQAAVETAKRAANRHPPRCRFAETTEGFDYAYPAATPTDIPSDGQFHAIPLAGFETDAAVQYVAVPRQSQQVFREVRLVNACDAALLEGPVDIMIGERFLMSTQMPHTPPGGRLRLGLGVEEAIQVSRNTHYQEHSALMSSAMDLRHEIRINLINHMPHGAQVEVRERIPAPADGDRKVKVTEGNIEPAWERYEQDDPPLHGGRRWIVHLEPSEKRSLRAEYIIHVSSKHEVAGGNRREA